MRRLIAETFTAFDAVHGRGASLREGRAICGLMAAFAAIAWFTALMLERAP